jgi:hypothetical protein
MVAVVPGIVYVYVVVGGVVAEADHGVAVELDEHRPSRVYLGFVLRVGKPVARVRKTEALYVLVEHPVSPAPPRPVRCRCIPVQIITA